MKYFDLIYWESFIENSLSVVFLHTEFTSLRTLYTLHSTL